MIDQMTAFGGTASKPGGAFGYASHALLAGAVVAAALVAQTAVGLPRVAPAPAVKPASAVVLPPSVVTTLPSVQPVVVAEPAGPMIVDVASRPVVMVTPMAAPLTYSATARDVWAKERGATKAIVPAKNVKVVPETPEFLKEPIAKASAKYGIPAEVLSAALARESANFKPKYLYGYHVDGAGRGVAGIDKRYHPNVSDAQAFDPEFSVDWMGRYLGGILKKNGGNVYNALREYNGGPNFASSRAGYQGRTVAELTQTHADAIMSHAARAMPA